MFGGGAGEGRGAVADAERAGRERAGHEERTGGDTEVPLATGRVLHDFLGLFDQLATHPERVTIPT